MSDEADKNSRFPAASQAIPEEPIGSPLVTKSLIDENSTFFTISAHANETRVKAVEGRYELGEEIARGGMGIIYSSRDTVLDRVVAVKVLMEKFGAGSAGERRFADEACISAQLQHPGIPPVHDLGVLPNGRPFLAMKLIKGHTLDAKLALRKDPGENRGEFLAIFEQICHAVAYAHSRRVIHRDLKPSNVMVGAFGEVQVMDWGLAKVLEGKSGPVAGSEETASASVIMSGRDDDLGMTQAGTILGTPAFMPPEQALGTLGKIDERSDVFGLGGILAVILTGKPPYADRSAETSRLRAAQGRVEECFNRLDEVGADPELVALCKRCLCPDPDGRLADAGKVALAVGAFRAAAEERARKAELDRVRIEGEKAASELREVEQKKRRRVQFVLVGTLAILALAGCGFAWWYDHSSTRQRNELERAELQRMTDLEKVNSERRIEEAKQQLEADNRSRQEQERERRNGETVAALLEQSEASLREADEKKASLTLALAESRMAEKGAEHLAPRVARIQRDYRMLLELLHARDLQWELEGGDRPATEPNRVWSSAFKKYGIIVGETDTEIVNGLLKESVIREHLLYGLDQWHAVAPSLELIKLLNVLDPDELRQNARFGLLRGDRALLRETLRDPKVLEQPLRFLMVLGGLTYLPLDEREKILLPAVNKYPNDVSLFLTLTAMYSTYRDDSRSTVFMQVRFAQAAVSARPDNKTAWRYLGRSLWESNRPQESKACYVRSYEIDSNDLYTMSTLAIIYLWTGDLDNGLILGRKAVDLAPNYALARNNLGMVLDRRHDIEGAIREFRKAVQLNPDFALAYFNLASTLYRTGDIDGAIKNCRDAIRITPNYRQALTLLDRAIRARSNREDRTAPPPRLKLDDSANPKIQQKM